MGGIFPAYDDRYAKIHFKKWRRGATTSETDFEIVSYLEYDKKKERLIRLLFSDFSQRGVCTTVYLSEWLSGFFIEY